MKAYKVLTPINDGKALYSEGDTMQLSDDQAAQLLEVRAIELDESKPQQSNSKKK